jgi:hypothetical protein
MMKKITLLLVFFSISFGFSQTELLNLSFDAAGSESIWIPIADAAANPSEVTIAYNAGGNGTGATQLSGVNTATTAGRAYIFRYNNGAFNYGTAGTVSISMDIKIDAELVGTNLSFETQVSKVGGGVITVTHSNVQSSVTTGSGWTTVTYDMTPNPAQFNNAGTELNFFFNMAAGAFAGAGGTILVDNIVVTGIAPAAPTCSDGILNGLETGIDCGGSTCPACPPVPTPTVSAPTPTSLIGQVINKYSDTYNPGLVNGVSGTNWTQGGTYSGVVDSTIDGIPSDLVKRYDDLFIAFINWDGPGLVNATAMNFFHIDVWTSNGANINIKLENQGPAISGNATFALIQNQWNSIEIDLNSFGTLATPANRNAVFQLILDAASGADIFIDNVYFSAVASLGTNNFEIAGLNVYPNPARDSWTVKTQNINMSSIQVFDVLGKSVLSLKPNASEATINGSSLKSGLYFARINTLNGSSSLKLIKN